MNTPNEFLLDSVDGLDFQVDAVADGLLGFEDQLDFNPELPAYDYGDLQAAAPLPVKGEDQVVAEVEEILLGLLEQDKRLDLLILTGELPDSSNSIPNEVKTEFSSNYHQAVLACPAIRWYSKLTKLLTPDQFSVQGGEVTLSMPRPMFMKVVRPFLSDFPEQWVEESPLVAVVRQVGELIGDLTATRSADVLEQDTKIQRNVEDGLDIGSIDFEQEPSQIRGNSADLLIVDDLFGNGQVTQAKIDISMVDLSNKAVAEYLDEQGLEAPEIEAKLVEEGFSKQRANEIGSIVRYMRLDRNLRKTGQATGNTGTGDVDLIPIRF